MTDTPMVERVAPMNGEIPDDLLKAAEDALDNLLCNCKDSLGSYAAVRAESIKDIARAIFAERMAERERCARIADAHSECERDCGDVIAAAIRGSQE